MIKKFLNSTVGSFLKESPKTTIGLTLILIMLIMTFGAPMFTDHDPLNRYKGEYHSPPSEEHILGTTRLGRDVFAQTLYGGRTSIAVGVFAGGVAVSLALVIGVTAGYFGGIVDNVISTVINVVMVIPQVVLLLIIASMLGGSSPMLIAGLIGITSWPFGARVIRAQTMSIRSREFIYSAETLGETKLRRLFIEIMPNMLSMISSAFVGTVIYAIMAQTFMEFIGFGDPLSVTWGTMLNHAQNSGALSSGIWWEVLGPSVSLIILGAGLTLINFSIDEVSNPKLRAQRFMASYYRELKKTKKAEKKNNKNETTAQQIEGGKK